MNKTELLSGIKSNLGNKVLHWHEKSPNRIYFDINPKDIVDVAKFFYNHKKARFNIASGVDTPKGIEILYHFTLDNVGIVFSVRALLVDKKKPEINSIASLFKGAIWIEREMWELLGVNFIGHPELKHLLLDDAWPKGQYPLRRDYKGDK